MPQFTQTVYIVYRKKGNVWVEIYRDFSRRRAKNKAWNHYYEFDDTVKVDKLSITRKTTTLKDIHLFRNNGGK